MKIPGKEMYLGSVPRKTLWSAEVKLGREGKGREGGQVQQTVTLVQPSRRQCRMRELEYLYPNTLSQRLGHGFQTAAKVPWVPLDILIFEDSTATAVRHHTLGSSLSTLDCPTFLWMTSYLCETGC